VVVAVGATREVAAGKSRGDEGTKPLDASTVLPKNTISSSSFGG
jgi:hypothetical protein